MEFVPTCEPPIPLGVIVHIIEGPQGGTDGPANKKPTTHQDPSRNRGRLLARYSASSVNYDCDEGCDETALRFAAIVLRIRSRCKRAAGVECRQ
jgi:hypothetical protein